MGDSNITINVTDNVTGNLINVMRGIKSYNGEKPEDFSDWRKKTGFIHTQHTTPGDICRDGRTDQTDKGTRRCGHGRGGHGTYLSCTAVHTRVP